MFIQKIQTQAETKNPNLHMDRTLTLNNVKGQRELRGYLFHWKKYNKCITKPLQQAAGN